MSYIAFNSANHESVLVRGTERYHMAAIVHDMMMVAVRKLTAATIAERGNIGHYVTQAAQRVVSLHQKPGEYEAQKRLDEMLATYIRVGEMSGEVLFAGVQLFEASLNTAFALGSMPVKLAARIHGQCEVHLWIAAEHAKAVSATIENARAIGIFREGMGWEEVIELLRRDDVGDVVLSYSVTDSFPNRDIAVDDRLLVEDFDWRDRDTWDEATRNAREAANADADYLWYETFTDAERWTASMRGLRQMSGGLQLIPDEMDEFFFGNGETGFNMLG